MSLLSVLSCAAPSKSETISCVNSEHKIQGLQENVSAMNFAVFHQAKGETFPNKIEWKLTDLKKLVLSEFVFDLSFDPSVEKWKILKGPEAFGYLVFLTKSVQGEAFSVSQCFQSGLRIEITREGIIENAEWFSLRL
jgi:hypothetical protein